MFRPRGGGARCSVCTGTVLLLRRYSIVHVQPPGVQIKFRRRRGEFTHPRRARQALRPYLCLSLAAILAAEEEEVHSYYTAHKVSVRPAAIYRRSNNHHRPDKPPRFSHQVWKICCNARFRHTHRLSPLCVCIVGCMSMMPNSCSALFKMLSCTEIW